MITINLFDGNFPGQACSVALQTPTLMRYVRGRTEWDGITVFTDNYMYTGLVDDVQSRYKIGWLHEARALHPENYERIGTVAAKFNAIMTHDAKLLASGAPFIKTIRGGSWVALDAWGMPPKTKNVSMILSDKTQLEGHKMRHAIAQAGLPIDLYGPSFTPIGHEKRIAYQDYRFAVVVEACKEDNFFSEHLIDALAFGCVPLYWGCPNLYAYFDPEGSRYLSRGIWAFATMSELADLLVQATPPLYHNAQPQEWIRRNQENARAYAITEDWQIQHCLAPFVGAV